MILFRNRITERLKPSRSCWSIPSLLALLLLPTSTLSAQNLLLTLSSDLPNSGVISTRSVDALSVTVASGSSISLAQSSGRDYRLEASGGFYWTQVQELPRDVEAVTLSPVQLDDGNVEVLIERRSKAGDREQNYQSTVIATPGEWVQLFGPARPASSSQSTVKTYGTSKPQTKIYGTKSAGGQSLYLKVATP